MPKTSAITPPVALTHTPNPVSILSMSKQTPVQESLGELLEACGGYNKIARYAKLDAGYVHRVLNGKQGCSLAAAGKLAVAMGITIDHLYAIVEGAKTRPAPGAPLTVASAANAA